MSIKRNTPRTDDKIATWEVKIKYANKGSRTDNNTLWFLKQPHCEAKPKGKLI